jgi:altronate hydrolase
MDVGCGAILEGEASIEEMGRPIFSLIVDVASGQAAKSELLGVGDEEMVPWQLGAVM